MASGAMCRTNRSDTWPRQPALQRRPKTLANGEPSTQGRTDASASCFRDGRSGHNLRPQPKTAFLRFPAVHKADQEGHLRVEKLWGPRQRSGTLVVVRKPI